MIERNLIGGGEIEVSLVLSEKGERGSMTTIIDLDEIDGLFALSN